MRRRCLTDNCRKHVTPLDRYSTVLLVALEGHLSAVKDVGESGLRSVRHAPPSNPSSAATPDYLIEIIIERKPSPSPTAREINHDLIFILAFLPPTWSGSSHFLKLALRRLAHRLGLLAQLDLLRDVICRDPTQRKDEADDVEGRDLLPKDDDNDRDLQAVLEVANHAKRQRGGDPTEKKSL